jgi:hypothetical protein
MYIYQAPSPGEKWFDFLSTACITYRKFVKRIFSPTQEHTYLRRDVYVCTLIESVQNVVHTVRPEIFLMALFDSSSKDKNDP